MSLLLIGLDATIVNVALPAIHRSLHAPITGLQWTIDSYTLVLASLLILCGSTADRLGRKRIFRYGLVLFVLGSALCAVAPTLETLIAARVLQAIGGSMLNPVALSIVRNVFTDGRERATAIGIWGATFGLSMALGPVLGGVLIALGGWRLVFLVNLPLGVVAFLLTTLYVPESRAQHPRAIDITGQVLVILGLSSLVYAIIEGNAHGWGSVEIVSLFVVSVFSFAALVPWELRQREPLLDVRFFRSAPFAGASVIAILAFGSINGFLFLNTLYLQGVRGYSAFHAGLCTLPIALLIVVLAPISGRTVGRRGGRIPLVVASISMLAGSAMLLGLTATTPLALLIGSYVVFGIGFGVVNPPITNAAVTGMPSDQAGVAAAVASTCRSVGGTLGIAVLGSVVGTGLTSSGSFPASFAQATHAGWWILFGAAILIGVIGIVTTSEWARGTARATAARLHRPAAVA
jgi:EmrB/QacA subfamily drug resistance transporter